MIKLNQIIIITFIGIIPMIGCGERIDITKYKGDGKIFLYGNKLFYPGFQIELDEIDLSNKFSKKYKMIDFPEMDNRYTIGLYVQSSAANSEDELDGILRMQLSNVNGVIFNVCSDINNWRKSKSRFDDRIEYFISYYDKN